MLSRRLLRIKVVKALFAHLKSGADNMIASEKTLMTSVDKAYDLYFQILILPVEIARYAEQRQELAKQKKLPTHEDLNPNTKFVDNQIIRVIANSDAVNDYAAARKLNWTRYPELIRTLYTQLTESDYFKDYMARPERHSYPILKRNMEFVINLTTKEMAFATDWCGVRSGKDYNKFEEMKLTPGKAKIVNAPIIEESPLCIECRVKEIISLGSHDMFIADVVNVKADDKYLNGETGKFELSQANPLVYVHGGYFELGPKIGKFGWSVEKNRMRTKEKA